MGVAGVEGCDGNASATHPPCFLLSSPAVISSHHTATQHPLPPVHQPSHYSFPLPVRPPPTHKHPHHHQHTHSPRPKLSFSRTIQSYSPSILDSSSDFWPVAWRWADSLAVCVFDCGLDVEGAVRVSQHSRQGSRGVCGWSGQRVGALTGTNTLCISGNTVSTTVRGQTTLCCRPLEQPCCKAPTHHTY